MKDIKRLGCILLAAVTSMMATSCLMDEIICEAPITSVQSNVIAFGANLSWNDQEDMATKSGAESYGNRIGNRVLSNADSSMTLPMGVYVQNGIHSAVESYGPATKGSVVSSKDGIDEFAVWANYKKESGDVIEYFSNVGYSSTDGIFYPNDASDEYYWPGSGTLTFHALSNAPATGFTANMGEAGLQSFTYTVPTDPTQQNDIMVAKATAPGGQNSSVALTFDHIMSAVNITVGQIVKGEIRSITLKNVYTTGNYLLEQGVWVVDKTQKGDFSVKMNGGKFVSTGSNPEGALINASNATFLFVPQNPGDDAEIVIEFYDEATGDLYSDTIGADAPALRARIAGDNWDKRKTINYMLSIDESFTLSIEPVGKKLDAHYVIGFANVTVEGIDNWSLTATTSDGSEVTIQPVEEVNEIAKQGFWTDYEVDQNGNLITDNSPSTGRKGYKSARGLTSWTGTESVLNKLFYIFVPENVGDADREISLILRDEKEGSSASTTKILLQKCPNWTDQGFGWEVVDDEEEGKYGFKFTRKRTFIFPYKLGSSWTGAHYTKDEAAAIADAVINTFNASAFSNREYYTQDFLTTRMYLQLDYTKLNNIKGAQSTTDGYSNTLALYDLGGLVTTGAMEVALENTRKTESGHEGEKMFRNPVSSDDIPNSAQNVDVTLDADGNSKVTEDLSGAITYILKKNRYYFQKKMDSGNNSTSYYAHFKREDLLWYMPASGQFVYFESNPNIQNDIPYNYWSSTAVDGEDYAFRGNGAQEDRTTELRVIAVRANVTRSGNTTATVDNTSLTGDDNGSTNNWL